MAELTESQIITKINGLDSAILTITGELESGGSAGAANLDYAMGNKRVDGTGRLKQLMEARKLYQGLLMQLPKIFIKNHDYSVDKGTGENRTELIGDEI